MAHVREKRLLLDRIKNHTPSLVLAITALITLVVTTIYAAGDGAELAAFEIAVFNFFNDLPNFLTPFFVVLTDVGTVGAVIVAGLVALLTQHRRIGLAILGSGVLSWAGAHVLKDLIARDRPNGFLTDIMIRYESLAAGNGFPSGHSAVAAGCAMSLAMILPRRYAPFLVGVVLLVGVSRIYLGVHLPLDVVGGFAIGIIVGYGVDLALRVERLRGKKSISTDAQA